MPTSDSPWLTDDQQRVWRSWLRASALLPVALHQQLQADSDLSFPDFEVLSELSEADEGRVRVGDLARALQWERSRVSHHLKRMGSRGLVGREDCAEDARGAVAVITPEGRTAIERAAPGHARTVRRLVFDELDADRLAALGGVLAEVVARLEETVAGGPGRATGGRAGRTGSSGAGVGPGPA